ncbi:sterol O-acyltransferase 2 isoform 5-T8 [Megaptera novaeangliae]
MEPRAAQLRRREGLGGEQEDRPSREGEPHFGNAECPGNNETHRGPDLLQWTRHMQAVKTQLLEQAQGQLTELLDQAMCEAIQAYPPQDRPVPSIPPDSLRKTREPSLGKRKVFINRKSLLDELMEVQHFRTIYHMFIAGLCVFIISTLAIDFIDEGRLMLEFDLLIFSFGQLPLALVTWVPMFLSTLLVPYQALRLWARPQSRVAWTLGVGLGFMLLAGHTAVLSILPVHVAVEYQLPPASRCVLVFEQVRLLMKSYSFLREIVPGTLRARGGPTSETPPLLPRTSGSFFLRPRVRGSGPPVSPATSISSSAPHSSTGRLTPGPGLRALCLFHPGPPLCSCLCQHEQGALQHPCPGALHHARHLARTGGTRRPSPTTTALGTWWSTTGCTATYIRTGCGYVLCTPRQLPKLMEPLWDILSFPFSPPFLFSRPRGPFDFHLSPFYPTQWAESPSYDLTSFLPCPQLHLLHRAFLPSLAF